MFVYFGGVFIIWTALIGWMVWIISIKFQNDYQKKEKELVFKLREDEGTRDSMDEEANLTLSEMKQSVKQRVRHLKPRENPISITFQGLGFIAKKSRAKLLQNVTGTVKSGEMCMIMGPSGCGKSTFLHTLAGKAPYGVTEGKVFLNDEEGTIQAYKQHIGFVPQEDIMHRVLTVKEILEFSARTRLRYSENDKILAVEEVLEMLGLSHVRFSVIGDENVRGISGGQRKRVNVGMELVADPKVLLLDEPTRFK